MRKNDEITSLTGLRFIAALYVFIFHMHMRWPLSVNGFTSNVISQGAVGMSVFFMLSGFLLSYKYMHIESNSASYLVNRLARIYPIYGVTMLITLPWIGINIFSGDFEINTQEFLKLILLLIANIFLIQAWFPQFFSYWNNGGSWSISVEAFLYIALPFLLPAMSRLKKETLFILIAVLYFLSLLPGLSINLFPGTSFPVFYATPIYRLPEFLIGACMLLVYKASSRENKYTTIQAIIFFGFIIYIGTLGNNMPSYIGHNAVTIPVIAFMLFSLASNKGIFAKILSNRILVWLGKVSYCFYSFQLFIILFMINNHDAVITMFPFFINNNVLALASFLVLVLLSAAGYYLIEEPARKKIKEIYKRRKIKNE
jgi:peptidoglycan/LPS O-acetylase OafA/YrhL